MNLHPLLSIGAAFLTLAAVATAVESADQGAAPSLRVLSANIRYGTADDGEHAWDKRSEVALQSLLAAKPDILGLQEALGFQVEAVQALFPSHALLGEGREERGEGEWCALLVDSQRFAIRASGTFRLSPQDEVGAMGWDAACTRIATWAELVDRARPGQPFLVLNAHFDHQGNEARHMSAKLVANWVGARQQARGSMPVIVMGDFNAVEKSPALTALKAAGYRDTYREKHPDGEPSGTFHGFKGGREGRRIDYVLVNPEWQIDDAWIDWTEKDGRFPSDHRFVGAVLRQGP